VQTELRAIDLRRFGFAARPPLRRRFGFALTDDVHSADAIAAFEERNETGHTLVLHILDFGEQQRQVESDGALH
jgi:hypothetical protein